jgi:hypothetical protein
MRTNFLFALHYPASGVTALAFFSCRIVRTPHPRIPYGRGMKVVDFGPVGLDFPRLLKEFQSRVPFKESK